MQSPFHHHSVIFLPVFSRIRHNTAGPASVNPGSVLPPLTVFFVFLISLHSRYPDTKRSP
jgi:hypothetical protein